MKVEIRNIHKVTLAGKQVKYFDVWKAVDEDKKVSRFKYAGRFSAPATVANKNLLSTINL